MNEVFFVSGHLDLTIEEFSIHYKPLIDNAIQKGACFVVGDARGTDSIAQNYLNDKTKNVTVYHMFTTPRNNAVKTVGGFTSDGDRDRMMTENSTDDIAWVRPGRESSDTAKNLARRNRVS